MISKRGVTFGAPLVMRHLQLSKSTRHRLARVRDPMRSGAAADARVIFRGPGAPPPAPPRESGP
jgi:hypothetical protein